VIGMMKNGDVEKLYTKWFMSPIPPKKSSANPDERSAQTPAANPSKR